MGGPGPMGQPPMGGPVPPMPGFGAPGQPPMGGPGQPPMPGFGAPGQPPMGGPVPPMPGFGAPGQPPMGGPEGAPAEGQPPMGAPQAAGNPSNEFEIVEGELVKYIGNGRAAVIPAFVTAIKAGAFEGAKGLAQIIIPESVVKIGARAFANCAGLRKLFIPASVTTIEKEAFLGCAEYLTINCAAPKAPKTWEKGWDKKGGGLFGGKFKPNWGMKG